MERSFRTAPLGLLIALGLAMPLTAATAPTPLGWRSVATLFRKRFTERSPDRDAVLAARLTERVAPGWRFDPRLDVKRSWDARFGRSGSLVSSLTQGSPWGTSLTVSHGFFYAPENGGYSSIAGVPFSPQPDNSNQAVIGLSIHQDLWREGPIYGLAQDRLARTKRQADELAAAVTFNASFYAAMSAFVNAQLAKRQLAAAERALERASLQNKEVEGLVASGFKAKADLLDTKAAELQAQMARQRYQDTFAEKREALSEALWQSNDQDPPLDVALEDPDPALAKALSGLDWPKDPPSVVAARLAVAVATLTAQEARRDAMPALGVDVGMDKPLQGPQAHEWEKAFGLSFSVPLVSGVSREKVALADIDQGRQEASLESAEASGRDLGAKHRRDAKTAEQAEETATTLLSLAQRSMAIQQQSYADGKSTIADVRRVQDQVNQAELDLMSARAALQLERLKMARDANLLQEVMP